MTNNRDAKTIWGALLRGLIRVVLLVSLAVIALLFLSGETNAGNRIFLWILAGTLGGLCAWGMVETAIEVKRIQRSR